MAARYNPYAASAYTVNTGQPTGHPGLQSSQFPTTHPVGGFGAPASAAPTGAIPQLAARLAGGPNPGSGLPGSIPPPTAPGPTPPTTPGPGPASGLAPGQMDPMGPPPTLEQLAGALVGRGGWQQPTGPDGKTSTTAASYFVPNNMTIDQITGGAPNPNMTSYQANSGFSPAQFAQIGFTLQADPAGNMYYALPPGAPAPNTG